MVRVAADGRSPGIPRGLVSLVYDGALRGASASERIDDHESAERPSVHRPLCDARSRFSRGDGRGRPIRSSSTRTTPVATIRRPDPPGPIPGRSGHVPPYKRGCVARAIARAPPITAMLMVQSKGQDRRIAHSGVPDRHRSRLLRQKPCIGRCRANICSWSGRDFAGVAVVRVCGAPSPPATLTLRGPLRRNCSTSTSRTRWRWCFSSSTSRATPRLPRAGWDACPSRHPGVTLSRAQLTANALAGLPDRAAAHALANLCAELGLQRAAAATQRAFIDV